LNLFKETEVESGAENPQNFFTDKENAIEIFGEEILLNDPIFNEISQQSIDNFDDSLFENVIEEEIMEQPVNQMVIEGLNEFLQVPEVIAFQVPTKVHDDIPMTVIDHQNYTQLETVFQLVSFKIILKFLNFWILKFKNILM
jgi:hypothetical protein